MISTTFLYYGCSISNPFLNLARKKAREIDKTATGEYIPNDATLQNIARKFRANEQSKALKR